ncbi:hypothetical protein AAA63_004406 [Salmonella enterica subsp. enterica]|nr:hypothetical protein [Salmonella enterica subsp. enterica serovar Poona]
MNQLAERNAEHVTKIAGLEARCAALAADNARLKSAIDATIEWQQSTDGENVESVRMLLNIKTTPTDAFLAEVRAQGVEMAIEHIEQTICPNHEMILSEFADRIRKGGAA